MKNFRFLVPIIGFLAAAATGCNKNANSSSSGKPGLTLSKSTVARGEQLTASVQDLASSVVVKWRVFPTPGTKILSGKDQAAAFFGNQGNYQLMATLYADSSSPLPYDSSSSPVIVSDSIYTPPPPVQSDTSALAGDAIQIEPITATDTGGLNIVAQTINLYGCNPRLNYYFSQVGNEFDLYFLSVSSSSNGCAGSSMSTAKAYIFAQAPAVGVYNFNVILNTATYRGTLTVTDQKYTFSWPYTSAVTISPQVIATK
jgi:hypothetical protein